MLTYKHKRTGAIVQVNSIVKGEWELLEEVPSSSLIVEEKAEEEAPKKKRKSRK